MKTGFWLKGGKGKLAGATVYQQNGETVMREVVSPSNPKTEKQQIQRIIMHTVMQAYSKMKEICDHSFEGIKKGADTMAYFQSQNIGFAREKVASMQSQGVLFGNMYNFVPLKLKGFTANQYQVAMGSLPPIPVTLKEGDDDNAFISGIRENTYAYVIGELGLQRGDQLTFLIVDGNNSDTFGQCEFHFCRVILDPTGNDYSQLPLSTPFIGENGKINAPSVRNEGNFNFAISAEDGLSFHHLSSRSCMCAAVIVSRQVNDKWLRSTTYLTYDPERTQEYSLGDCLEMAANGTNSQIYAAADAYLNNAGQGGGAAAEGTTNNSGSGSGGNSGSSPSTPSTPAITSASIDGQSMISGTTKTIKVAKGTEFPVSKALVVNTANATGKQWCISVTDPQDEEVANQIISQNGSCTINHAWAKDTIYSLAIVDDDETVVASSAFKFQITEDNGGGGGLTEG